MIPFSDQSNDDDESEDLIGLALGLVEDEPPRNLGQIHLHAAADDPSEARNLQVDRIRQNLYFLLNDEDHDDDSLHPPSVLIARTRLRVEADRRLQTKWQEALHEKPSWRLSDIAVAASVFFAFVFGSIPALQRSQYSSANLACSSNLLQLWRGLEQYSSSFNMYPNAVAHDKRLPVGAVIALLLHSGHIDKSVPLTCPGCSDEVCVGELPAWNELKNYSPDVDQRLSSLLSGAYAFHPGLASPQGIRHLERKSVNPFRARVPLIADAPPQDLKFQVQPGNSLTHGGLGQNVIFADGHTSFIRDRKISQFDSDLYSNSLGKAHAATTPMDMILVPATTRLPD